MRFPLLGLARDLHPLANAHAERTTKKVLTEVKTFLLAESISLEPMPPYILYINELYFSLNQSGRKL